MTSISVLGAGSWGTAIALLLARNGHSTVLWAHNPAHITEIKHARCNNRYLPGIELPETLRYDTDLAAAIRDVDIIVIAVPSHAFLNTLGNIKPHLTANIPIAWATKGLEPTSGHLLHESVYNTLGKQTPVAVISGPTFAMEVAKNLPTAITVASPESDFANSIAKVLHNQRFRVYTSDDIVGVQLGGAVKNVLAIATGAADGLGFGANTRAALVTRGLAELIRLGLSMNAKQETLMGLAGLGDIVLTCTDNQSRNRRLGLGLGQGKSIPEIIDEIGQEVEGVSAAREIYQLANKLQIEMPITEQVYKVLYENLAPTAAVQNLQIREQKTERFE